ncbi:MAG: F0F1 ATP synthase subunit B [Chloroflexi bacterium]|nr:F0F1 ATP synthase subunit B [Chloroflexota bacterium]
MLIIAQASGGLGINALAFISQLISFLIVFVLLWKWALPAVLRTLEKRQAVIREGVENAERAKQELAEASAEAERILTEAHRQAQETIDRGIKLGDQERRRIEEEAYARAEQISQQQIARIQQEANRARTELSRMVVNLSIDAAGKVIGKSVNTKDNRRLVEEFVTASDQTRNN